MLLYPMSLPIRITTALPLAIVLSSIQMPIAPSQQRSPYTSSGWPKTNRPTLQPFRSETGRFKALFPTLPKVDSERHTLAGETVRVHSYSVEQLTDAYFVVYTDMPSSYLRKGKQVVLDEISRSVLTDFKLEELLPTGKSAQLAGNPGKTFRLSNSLLTLDARFYLVNQRMYLLLGASQQEKAVDQFIESFGIL